MVGFDFGTSSARAVVVRCEDGAQVGAGTSYYPSGNAGILCDPTNPLVARQSPTDHLLSMQASVEAALRDAESCIAFDRSRVVAIGLATTGSSPLPIDDQNRALAMNPEFAGRLAAQCWLWKDHDSWREAQVFTQTAQALRPHLLQRCGGVYSSEWWWSKIWRCLNTDPEVFTAAYSWVELCDWLPSVLCGVSDPADIRRSICAAGHKALFVEEWGGLPDADFLAALDPRLAPLRENLYGVTFDARHTAGSLSSEWAGRLGLPEGIPVAIGAFDVHYGAIGVGIEPGTMVKVLGTSACDCAISTSSGPVPLIPGICGVVDGSILPGYLGIEAGQSAVGDIFRWWAETICSGDDAMQLRLTDEAALLRPGESGLIALDWNNGNRSILADAMLGGLIMGQSLTTRPADVYRALIEATAFGALRIIEQLEAHGVAVDRVVCAGGIAEKNDLVLEIYADVIGKPLARSMTENACAFGSAVVASVASGCYADFDAARAAMCSAPIPIGRTDATRSTVYQSLYRIYRTLHDEFGVSRSTSPMARLMKDLIAIRQNAMGMSARTDVQS